MALRFRIRCNSCDGIHIEDRERPIPEPVTTEPQKYQWIPFYQRVLHRREKYPNGKPRRKLQKKRPPPKQRPRKRGGARGERGQQRGTGTNLNLFAASPCCGRAESVEEPGPEPGVPKPEIYARPGGRGPYTGSEVGRDAAGNKKTTIFQKSGIILITATLPIFRRSSTEKERAIPLHKEPVPLNARPELILSRKPKPKQSKKQIPPPPPPKTQHTRKPMYKDKLIPLIARHGHLEPYEARPVYEIPQLPELMNKKVLRSILRINKRMSVKELADFFMCGADTANEGSDGEKDGSKVVKDSEKHARAGETLIAHVVEEMVQARGKYLSAERRDKIRQKVNSDDQGHYIAMIYRMEQHIHHYGSWEKVTTRDLAEVFRGYVGALSSDSEMGKEKVLNWLRRLLHKAIYDEFEYAHMIEEAELATRRFIYKEAPVLNLDFTRE
ncbi:hypothetical protein ABW19_dt0202077 [Dactylella cylindrospora]|nr:hypothetical protein ABW19_dt0202077 [Dactylella cylindrospora]